MNPAQRKTRIGLIVPPADGREPPECALLYPQFQFLTIGLGVKQMSPEGFAAVMDRLLECARTLASRRAEIISIMGTSFSFFRGNSFNEQIGKSVAQATGLPTTTMATAIVRALKASRTSRIALATAYTSDLNERLSTFLRENEIQTAGTVGLGLRDIETVRPISPQTVEQAAEAAFALDRSADGILISCGGCLLCNCIFPWSVDSIFLSYQACQPASGMLCNAPGMIPASVGSDACSR
jgi:arylmalonate decarboxylase